MAGAFGVRGEVRLKSFTQPAENLFDYSPFCDEAGTEILTVSSFRHVKDGFAAFCNEVASREEAAALKSTRLHVARERLGDLEDDEFYHADLIGMAVKGLDGRDLGLVRAVHDFGAGDLLEVWKTPGAKGAWYLPFTLAGVPHVDLSQREVAADPEDGLIPWIDAPNEEVERED